MNKKNSEKKRLKEWNDVLKNDLDGDYSYILSILAYKLKRTRDCLKKNGLVADIDEISQQILSVEKLLERVIDESNYDTPFLELDKKYGKLQKTNIQKNKDGSVAYYIKREFETPQNQKEIRKAFRAACKQSQQMRINDLKKAFSIITKYIWNWWD